MSSSNTADQEPVAVTTVVEDDNDNQEVTDLQARKLNDTTFDTEEESSDEGENADDNAENDDDDDEAYELDVKDAAVDILDQLVELFIEKNGREPNEEEVLQWIDVFKSLKIEDVDEDAQASNEEEEAPESAAPTAE